MQTIGERLEEARKKKGISIREAAEATKIRGDYLQKFESNHFDIGLTEIYTRGFLRTYANFLKLPADRMLNDYAALGRGEVRPRQPNREVYGRMDISVASAEAPERTAPSEEPVATAPEPSHANRGPQRSRATTSLPTGPDPAIVFKYVKWGGAAIIALLVLLILKSLFFSGGHRAAPTAATTQSPRGPVVGLNALGTVRVMVCKVGADGFSNGEQLYSGVMTTGETRSVPRPSAIFIEADKPDLLEIVINGTPYNLAKMIGPGNTKGQLGPPPGSSG
jgi:transcriptional regulator with XRE-family HTH domain